MKQENEPKKFSVSQAKTYKSCKRKWYLEKVIKLPIKFADSTTRGSILHEVLERWLLANEQGLDESGKPVDLYPKNWYIKKDDKTGQEKEISFAEQSWIRRIVEDAISKGVLWRPPNRYVEYKFEEELLPAVDGLPAIVITGYIDLAYDWTIGDHKSCKNLNWVLNDIPKSDKYIGDDLQLLTYCYYWAKYRTDNFKSPPPEFMDVEHYQYPFEGKDGRKGQGTPQTTKTKVTWKRILENMEHIKSVAEKCRETRFQSTNYLDIEPNEDACGKYGGCNFAAICAGQESLDSYRERIKYLTTPITVTTKEQINMSDIFDDLLEETNKNDEANTATTKTEEKAVETKAETKTEEKLKFNVQGTKEELIEKVATLQKMQDEMGMDMSAQIDALQEQIDKLDAEEKAKEAKAKAEAEEKAKKEAEEQAKKEASKEADKASKSESDVQNSDESSVSGSVEAQGSNDSDAHEAYEPNLKVKAKRAPSGVILCINGHVQGYSKYITAQKIFDEYSKSALAYIKKNGMEMPNPFQLRDAVADKAEEIVESLKGFVILSNSITADTRVLNAKLAELDNVQVFIGNAS